MGLTAPPPREAWGITGKLTPLAGGCRNTALRSDGTPGHVLKTTSRTEAALRWLAPVQHAAQQAGFDAPALIPGNGGTLRVNGWTCEPFLPGTPLPAADLPALAPALARFHALTARAPQRPGFATAADLLTQDRGGDIDLAALPPDLAKACRAAWHAVSKRPKSAIHADLSPSNILRGPDGIPILLDWDEARVDARLFDDVAPHPAPDIARARMAWEIACGWLAEPGRARALVPAFLDSAA